MTLRIGALGAGGFGLFALQQFLQIPGVSLVAMAGTHREAALAMMRRFGVPDVIEEEALLASPEVDLVYIATPPFLHYAQARAALLAGKHVICEKPLALTTAEADDLVSLARSHGLLCIANLMQRYNPVFDAVLSVIHTRALGEFLHGSFENFASDEGLTASHWFWDPAKSGGIFIEHGVHFFDLFQGWLGDGAVIAAQRTIRPGTTIEESVQCTVRYPGGALVNFHHSFTQPSRLDRQAFRLHFERGTLTLHEWVPIRVRIEAAVNEEQTLQLMTLFPGAKLDVLKSYGGASRQALGRHKPLDISQDIDLTHGADADKMRRYCELLRSLMHDQLTWLENPNHIRKITEQNGRDSLALADTATRLALANS